MKYEKDVVVGDEQRRISPCGRNDRGASLVIPVERTK
jgi:hypothetical protein